MPDTPPPNRQPEPAPAAPATTNPVALRQSLVDLCARVADDPDENFSVTPEHRATFLVCVSSIPSDTVWPHEVEIATARNLYYAFMDNAYDQLPARYGRMVREWKAANDVTP
jgi:hypothetical protein